MAVTTDTFSGAGLEPIALVKSEYGAFAVEQFTKDQQRVDRATAGQIVVEYVYGLTGHSAAHRR